MQLSRRSLLLAAPAIVAAPSLMRISALVPPRSVYYPSTGAVYDAEYVYVWRTYLFDIRLSMQETFERGVAVTLNGAFEEKRA